MSGNESKSSSATPKNPTKGSTGLTEAMENLSLENPPLREESLSPGGRRERESDRSRR